MTFVKTRNVHVTLEIDATVRITGEYTVEAATNSRDVDDLKWEYVDIEAVLTDVRRQLDDGTDDEVDRLVREMTHDELRE